MGLRDTVDPITNFLDTLSPFRAIISKSYSLFVWYVFVVTIRLFQLQVRLYFVLYHTAFKLFDTYK